MKENSIFKPSPRRSAASTSLPPEQRRLARIAARAGLLALLLQGAPFVCAQESDITDLNLEQLMNMEVTSVNKKAQKLSGVAAAVYVITQEDIRRSGVTSIPEALRLAPGVQVARIDANKWAITARGFNGRFANKLLVLMDGRNVYTPTYAGVYWEAQDTVLEDIDRIEVIRGPGATAWGSNAVNGVVNIITKQAAKTQGGEVTIAAGSPERVFGSARYGFQWGENTHGRVYVKGFDFDRFHVLDAEDKGGSDAWNSQRGGFRLDHDSRDGELWTLQGDMYTGSLNQDLELPQLTAPYSLHLHDTPNMAGANLLGRWQKALGIGEDISLQVFYDHTVRNESFIDERRDTVDVDFQHHLPFGEWHDVIWGLGYRYTYDRIPGSPYVSFGQPGRGINLYSGFLQDEISLIPDQLKLTLGSKLEHNDFTGFEVQPSLRLAWTPNNQHAVWGAVSRAVRTPSRAEDSANTRIMVLPPFDGPNVSPFPVALQIRHNKAFLAETLLGFELGYRFMPSTTLTMETALFYNVYNRLRGLARGDVSLQQSGSTLYAQQELPFSNNQSAHTYGGELAINWNPEPWWTLQAHYSYIGVDLVDNGIAFSSGEGLDASTTPQQQWSLRSGFDLPYDVELDLWLRYVDRIRAGTPQVSIPDYLTLDARLGWRPHPSLDLSLVGQNLLDSAHPEFIMESGFQGNTVVEIPRGFYLKANWRF
ncbi:TonB-dependent receptor plug domain-containing protein [Methyloterricola oryzae]|uniref:TonB-dependent receptor plug domain-containing protein n=1 Tax=Methyloterricola oryzae TaxID=1495050 RepID=UPI00069AF2E3|nr:TonB-dependent receptor [Methyloterricola oryzae]